MDSQEALQRQKKSLQNAEFERKLFEEQAKDLEDAIEARREEMKRTGDQEQDRLTEARGAQEQQMVEAQAQEVENQNIELQAQIDQDIQNQNAQEFETINQSNGSNVTKAATKSAVPPKPGFPIFMLPLALVKDLFDIILTLTGIGVILVVLYSFIYNINLFVWTRGKMTKGISKTMEHKPKGFIAKYIMTALLELAPGIGMAPLATWFVFNIYKNEVDIWKKNTKK